MPDSWLRGAPEPLRRHYKLACALLDALPADVGLTAAQVEAAATHLLKLGYRQRAFGAYLVTWLEEWDDELLKVPRD